MARRKSLVIGLIFTLFLCFNLISCSGGGGDSVGFIASAAPPLKVFVTSATGSGNLQSWTEAGGASGLAAGDAICQARATAAGLSGTYRAWLSTSTVDAYCHIQGFTGTILTNCGQGALPVAAGPWVRTDGHPFADTIDKLINNGQVFAPVRYDENGTVVATGDYDSYFTDTLVDGSRYATYNCANWTSNSGTAALGRTAGTTDWWTEVTTTTCGNPARLLCFQTGTGGPLPSITAPALSKKVFVTSVTGKGNLADAISWPDYSGSAAGVEAGDTICQARAAAGGVANPTKFKAWLTDATHNDAKARFTSDGPWYRLDGVKVADNKAALNIPLSGPLFTAITYTETRIYVQNSYYRVWSGTGDNGMGLADNCTNWGSTSGTATVGDTHTSDSWWTAFTDLSCNETAALYCFEDD